MKRLLLIAHDFPPRGATGVFRVLKFARYLPEWGWQLVVVTMAGAGPHPDPRLLAELPPNLEVHHVRAPGMDRGPSRQPQRESMAGGWGGWRHRLKPWFVPDPRIVWVPGAVTTSAARLRRGDITAVMTSGPPFSTHLAGWWLKRRFPHIPWLMDMRDLWSESVDQRDLVRYKLNRWLEQQCMQAADHVTVVTDGIRDLTLRRLRIESERISTLTNGFDPNDLVLPPPAYNSEPARPGPLQIRYIGTVAPLRAASTASLFQALRQLQDEGVSHKHLRLQLIGSFAPSVREWAAPLVATGIVEILPFVPHDVALELMTSADVLLLILTDDWEGRIAHSNKLFEYLAVGHAILAIAPEGEVTRLLRTERAGFSVAPSDVPAIVDVFRQLIAANARGDLRRGPPGPDRFRHFHRRELTGQLARLLDTIAGQAVQHAAA